MILRMGGSTRAPAPARTRVVVNQRAAEQMHIKWDPEILRSVDQVFE